MCGDASQRCERANSFANTRKFASPELPEFIGEFTRPKANTIRAGEVNPLFGRKDGGFQYDMMQQRMGEFKEIGRLFGKLRILLLKIILNIFVPPLFFYVCG